MSNDSVIGDTSLGPMDKLCAFCQKQEARYTCPQCSKPYCSVKCFNSSNHRKCSEEFYKELVQQHMLHGLRLTLNKKELADRLRMLHILSKYASREVADGKARTNDPSEEWYYYIPQKELLSLESSIITNAGGNARNYAFHDSFEESDDGLRSLTIEEEEELERLVSEALTEKLLSLLTNEERSRFEASIKDMNYIVDD